LVWHQAGPVFAAGSSEGTVWVFNGQSGKLLVAMYGHSETLTCGMFTTDGFYFVNIFFFIILSIFQIGKKLVTGSADGTVKLWNPREGTCEATFKGTIFFQSK